MIIVSQQYFIWNLNSAEVYHITSACLEVEPQDCIQAEVLNCTYFCQAGHGIYTSWLINGISRSNSDSPTTETTTRDDHNGTIESLTIPANQSYNESNITCHLNNSGSDKCV